MCSLTARTHLTHPLLLQHPNKPQLLNVLYTANWKHTQTSAHSHINIGLLISVCIHEVQAMAKHKPVSPKHTNQLCLTLKGSHITWDEKLEAGAGCLEKILDVSPGRQLVLLLHLLGAACQVLGHAHLKVWPWESLRLNVMILTHLG